MAFSALTGQTHDQPSVQETSLHIDSSANPSAVAMQIAAAAVKTDHFVVGGDTLSHAALAALSGRTGVQQPTLVSGLDAAPSTPGVVSLALASNGSPGIVSGIISASGDGDRPTDPDAVARLAFKHMDKDDEPPALRFESLPTLYLVGRSGLCTKRDMSEASAELYKNAFESFEKIVCDKYPGACGHELDLDRGIISFLTPPSDPVDLSEKPVDIVINEETGETAPFIVHRMTIPKFLEGASPAVEKELTIAVQNMRNVADISGKVGAWRTMDGLDLRGAAISPDHALSSNAPFLHLLATDFDDFAKKDVVDMFKELEVDNPVESLKDVMRAEAYHNRFVDKLKKACKELEAEIGDTPKVGADDATLKKMQRLEELKHMLGRLETERRQNRRFFLYAAVHGVGDLGEAAQLAELHKKAIREKAGFKDDPDWFDKDIHAMHALDEAVEGGLLVIQKPEDYLLACQEFNKSPVKSSAVSFILHGLHKEGEMEEMNLGEYGLRLDDDGQALLSEISQEAYKEADEMADKIDDKLDAAYKALDEEEQIKQAPKQIAKLLKDPDFSAMRPEDAPSEGYISRFKAWLAS